MVAIRTTAEVGFNKREAVRVEVAVVVVKILVTSV